MKDIKSIKQNGLKISLDNMGKKVEILSIPSLKTDLQGVGVANASGFNNLQSIRGNTYQERIDALKLVVWSMTEIDYLIKELQWKEDSYVELAVDLLRNTMKPKMASDDILHISQQNASEMVEQLKAMLTPSIIKKAAVL